MAIIAGIIDTTWYVLVALVLAGTSILEELRRNAIIIDRSIGMVLILFSILLIVKIIGWFILTVSCLQMKIQKV